MECEDRVAAFEVEAGAADGGGEIAGLLVFLFDEVRDHLRVGFGLEGVAFRAQVAAEFQIVLDDAVVDDGDGAIFAQVRVGVALRHAAVRGPARVGDGERAIVAELIAVDYSNGADVFFDGEVFIFLTGHSPRVVAAVFEVFEPFNGDFPRVLAGADVSEDATHRRAL